MFEGKEAMTIYLLQEKKNDLVYPSDRAQMQQSPQHADFWQAETLLRGAPGTEILQDASGDEA